MEWQMRESATEWAVMTYGSVMLGHEQRTKRAVKIASALARDPMDARPKGGHIRRSAVEPHGQLLYPVTENDLAVALVGARRKADQPAVHVGTGVRGHSDDPEGEEPPDMSCQRVGGAVYLGRRRA